MCMFWWSGRLSEDCGCEEGCEEEGLVEHGEPGKYGKRKVTLWHRE